jgi:uncharacterized protein (DUF1499 family)
VNRRASTIALSALGTVLVAAVVLLAAGQAGLLSGAAPPDLGVHDGRLKPPSPTPNSVSSQAHLHAGTGALVDHAQIEPIAGGGDLAATMARLRRAIEAMPGSRIVEARPDYIHVQFTSRWLKFVDDAEFWASGAEGMIHVRSASRLGDNDFGVNRARIETLRAALAAAPG